MIHVARSGFRHVRLCNDCKLEIDEDGRCGCPDGSPWSKGQEITICSDAAGEHPIALAKIARIGNGQFRVDGAPRWFSMASGESTHGDHGWARPRRDGDANLVALADLKSQRIHRASDAKRYRSQAAQAASEARHHESRAASYRTVERERVAKAAEMEAAVLVLDERITTWGEG